MGCGSSVVHAVANDDELSITSIRTGDMPAAETLPHNKGSQRKGTEAEGEKKRKAEEAKQEKKRKAEEAKQEKKRKAAQTASKEAKTFQEKNFIRRFDEDQKNGFLETQQNNGAAAAAAAADSAETQSEKDKIRNSAGPKVFLGPAKGHTVSFNLDDGDDEIEAVGSGSNNDIIDDVIQELTEEDDDYGDFDPQKFQVANSMGKHDTKTKLGFIQDIEDTEVLIVSADKRNTKSGNSLGGSSGRSCSRPGTTGTSSSGRFHISDEELMQDITA